ncbi:nodulation protein NfeD [Vogesella sp. LYT5W]|uniref:Nodulation protein NfeD n=1 Tax=Vogesella margarita TaxID=2984199 RepID=A0ABT5IQB3_9NEIS|nr:nodulation protein NfeD [Vogesella margarita]MDC7714745.1 nodulation protein NfeD [Vogesella margarita]
MSKLWQFLAVLWLALLPALTAAATPAPVVVIPLSGAIGPASADHVGRSLARAQREGAQLAVLQMDTPGGLDTSMRQIIKAILASPVPVASFVAPSGARAASAGTYILYASHIAAMAPGTNLGAATPVQIGMTGSPDKAGKPDSSAPASSNQDALSRKQVNDAAAYIRGLAQLRGRNVEWAERAVREAVSLSAGDALALRVVDLTARDLPDLLQRLDGRSVPMAGGTRVLHTNGAAVITLSPDWRSRFLGVIADPSMAMILMMLGIYGLLFEFSNPGFVLPGVVGATCLLLGLYALQMLPVNYTGLALLLLGLGCMIAEAFLPSFGTLGLGGIVAFVIGGVMLVDTEQPGLGVPLGLILALAVTSGLFVFLVSGMALKARRRPQVGGEVALIGSRGEMLDDLDGEGWAIIRGECWHVYSATPLKRGQPVRVTARQGLRLEVTPSSDTDKGAPS